MAVYIIGFSGIFIIGVIKILLARNTINKMHKFAIEYYQSFSTFSSAVTGISNVPVDGSQFIWLIKNSDRIQNDVGRIGIIKYKPAGANYFIENYHLIISTIMMFQEGQYERYNIQGVQNCILRHIGILEDEIDSYNKNLLNPLIWFREGIRFIIGLPILLLREFGIITAGNANAVFRSLIFKIIAGIIALVSFLANLMTIILGQEQSLKIIQQVLNLQIFNK